MSGADQCSGQISTRFSDGFSHGPLSHRLDPEVHGEMRDNAEYSQSEYGRGNLPARHSCSLSDDNLTVLVDPVQRPDAGHEQGQRRQQGDDLWRAKHDNIEICQSRLPVFKDQVSAGKPLSQQGEHRQSADDDNHSSQHFEKEVCLDLGHKASGGLFAESFRKG